ncbi:hypothetical protein [Endomicrobium proavitum]|uniref:Molecular chaperone n=1 Tax=Endomicrobium proavitum TaxID=1408281 RepID=A0A0G3WJD3_9BACT|nr:hypothetical protein [Endomicrobium proavitum]AKL97970.1 exported protein of unknown function [Endomicrobium proavitum]
MKKLLCFSLLMLFVCSAHATLSVYPSRIDAKVAQNDTLSSEFTITNNYDGDIEVTVATQDWNTYKGNGELDINSWLTVSPKTIKIKQGGAAKVKYIIKTNSSMKGSVSGQVSFSYMQPGNEMLNMRMSFPVYLTIHGTEKIDYEIGKISFYKSQLSDKEIKLQFAIKNNGNIHLRPQGLVNIYDNKNNLVQTTKIISTYPIYAESERGGFHAEIPDVNIKPGKYTAEIVLENSGITVTKKTQFRLKKDGSVTQ